MWHFSFGFMGVRYQDGAFVLCLPSESTQTAETDPKHSLGCSLITCACGTGLAWDRCFLFSLQHIISAIKLIYLYMYWRYGWSGTVHHSSSEKKGTKGNDTKATTNTKLRVQKDIQDNVANAQNCALNVRNEKSGCADAERWWINRDTPVLFLLFKLFFYPLYSIKRSLLTNVRSRKASNHVAKIVK